MVRDQDKAVSRQIDEICDEFENAWKNGHPLRIEDCLAQVDKEHEAALLRELLEIEISLHDRDLDDGNNPNQTLLFTSTAYRSRFPEHGELVDSIIKRLTKQKQIGDYEIIGELGHGGMGVVYKARQRLLNQIVAIKVLPQSLLNEPQAVGRFRREMQLIGGLNHPNIVRALNAGEADGTQYLVMEFVDGINLQKLGDMGEEKNKKNSSSRITNHESRTTSRIPLAAVCEIIRQAALGLQHAHEFGLVHRDIKPANLMVDKSGTVKILDLGLGKFLSEHRPADDIQSLTKIGTTMGTIDYISPEQCENAGNVDIRADIYSLGCTFYFLATGHAPYSDSRFDSTRKKLMAHIVGDIPSLTANVPEAGGVLEKIFNKTLAKEPEERFQTPLELAQALQPFSDENVLLDYVDAWRSEHGMDSGTKSSTRPHSSRLATNLTDNPYEIRKSKRIFWSVVISSVVAGLGIGISLPFFLGSRPTGPSGAVVSTQQNPVTDVLADARTNLPLLPGLNGRWWFDEIPWYLPAVRSILAQKLSAATDPKTVLGDEPEKYFDPNASAVDAWLWTVVSKYSAELTPTQRKLVDSLKTLSETCFDNTATEKAVFGALTQLVADHSAETPWLAVDQHARAILEHRLALLKEQKELAAKAMKSYRTALELYRNEIDAAGEGSKIAEQLRPMEFLCLADTARLEYLASGDYAKANADYDAVSSSRKQGERFGPLFTSELRATHGALRAEWGQFDDSLFTRAAESLKKSKAKDDHPLGAYVAERYAWSLIDQWKIKEAGEQFQTALLIRQSNQMKSKNPFASIYVYHDQHGLAMTYRYRGNTQAAIDEYRRTLGQIDKELDDFRTSPDSFSSRGMQYRESLRERAANTRERLADCTLYGGAATGAEQGKLTEAAKQYAEAAELYDSGAPEQVMLAKQAIVLLLSGDVAQGQKILDKLNSDERNKKDLGFGNRERTKLILQLSNAVLAVQKGIDDKPNEGLEHLRLFLRRFDSLSGAGIEGTRRENLEMRMFCAEYLLDYSLDRNDIGTANSDVAFLYPPLGIFINKPETRPFIRRLVDLVIKLNALAFEKDNEQKHLGQIVKSIKQLRGPGRPITASELSDDLATVVSFYLTEEPADGFVVFFPQDGRPASLYRLPLTRQMVKNASKKNQKPYELDAKLCEAINAEKQAGRPIVVSWDDTVSWAHPEDAITDADWPFKEPP